MKNTTLQKRIREILLENRDRIVASFRKAYENNDWSVEPVPEEETAVYKLASLFEEYAKEIIGGYEYPASSLELEKEFKANEGNISREEIFEADLNRVLRINEVKVDQYIKLAELTGGGK